MLVSRDIMDKKCSLLNTLQLPFVPTFEVLNELATLKQLTKKPEHKHGFFSLTIKKGQLLNYMLPFKKNLYSLIKHFPFDLSYTFG